MPSLSCFSQGFSLEARLPQHSLHAEVQHQVLNSSLYLLVASEYQAKLPFVLELGNLSLPLVMITLLEVVQIHLMPL